MSLKTDYLDGSTGLTQKMAAAFDAGSSFVTANLGQLSTELKSAAAKGQKIFTVIIAVSGSASPDYLKLNGLYLQSFFAGIKSQLAVEDIFDYEVALSLNTADLGNLKVNFNFTF